MADTTLTVLFHVDFLASNSLAAFLLGSISIQLCSTLQTPVSTLLKLATELKTYWRCTFQDKSGCRNMVSVSNQAGIWDIFVTFIFTNKIKKEKYANVCF